MKHRRTLWILAAGLLAVAADSRAEPSTRVAFTTETLRAIKHGDVGNGAKLAEPCEACHGAALPDAVYPALRGQLPAFLYKQLMDYRSGSRSHEVMSAMAAELKDQDIADIAAWYASQPRPSGRLAASRIGEALAVNGDTKRLIPPCRVCHGGNGEGRDFDVPSLVGQTSAYLSQTLRDYQSGTRHNDTYGRMREIAKQLSAEEIDALAQHYGGR